mgnify:CR=1 FL=1
MSSNGITRTKIGNVCEITSSKRIYRGDYVDDGVPFYRGKEVIERHRGNLDVSTELFISEDKFRQIEAKFGAPQAGDLLLTSVGTIGIPFVVPPNERFYFKDGNLTWFRKFDGLDSHFLYYWLHSAEGEAQWRSGTIGVAQPALTIGRLKEMEIVLPPLPTQRRIAGILSAYDDLIENNLRRIKILEEMAQSLYREWFVHFRIPSEVLTKAGLPPEIKLVDSPLGPIPEGWEVKKLKDACHLTMGQSPKSEFYNDEGDGTPFHQGVTNFGDHFPTDRLFCTIDKRMAETGDILFSVRAPVGRINVADKRIVIGRGVSAIRNLSGHQDFLYFQLKQIFQEEDSMGNGAIFNAVTKSDMQGIDMLTPPERVVARFEQTASPIFQSIKNLTSRNRTLRHTRDLLLPKLLRSKKLLITKTMKEIRLPNGVWEYDEATSLGKPGGFGQVFIGRSTTNDEVAVKRLHLTAASAAHREMAIAEELVGKAFASTFEL